MPTTFKVDYSPTGRAKCNNSKCKRQIEKGALRIGKVGPNPFAEGHEMTLWYHADCYFDQQTRMRKNTQKLEKPEDLQGLEKLQPEDKEHILQSISVAKEHIEKKAEKQKPAKQKKLEEKEAPETHRETKEEPGKEVGPTAGEGPGPTEEQEVDIESVEPAEKERAEEKKEEQPEETQEQPKKRRGRPPKKKEEAKQEQPKKRGRPAKKQKGQEEQEEGGALKGASTATAMPGQPVAPG